MRKIWILTFITAGLCIAAGVGRTHASAPVTELRAANAEHGAYIVEHVAMCIECHSPRDSDGRILAGKEFTGAPIPVPVPPSDWATRAPRNRGLLGYDDEQAMRLLTQGAIGRNGEQLQLPMPRFRMTHEDAADVIAFMRSLH
jgi:mono/diheme cytochrome c family protein